MIMNTISIGHKWVSLFRSDIQRTLRKTLAVAMVLFFAFISIYLAAFLLFNADISPVDRNVIIFIMCFLYAGYIPIGAFSHINGDRNDVIHILLPVNRHLKFISALVAGSIVVPACFIALLYFADWLVCSISAGAEPAFQTCLLALKAVLDVFMAQSVFVLCNILFKRHKVGLSLLFMLIFLGGIMLFDNVIVRYILPSIFYVLAYDRFVRREL